MRRLVSSDVATCIHHGDVNTRVFIVWGFLKFFLSAIILTTFCEDFLTQELSETNKYKVEKYTENSRGVHYL